MKHCCSKMAFFLGERKVRVGFSEVFRSYHIETTSDAAQNIEYCPWCGATLPASLRHEWFQLADALGIEDPLEALWDKRVPEEMQTSAWWRKRGL